MIANAIERALVRLAIRAGADDPEAVAHDIIVRALEGRVVVRTHAFTYLRHAASNQAGMYRRHAKRMVYDEVPVRGGEDNTDAYLDVRRLVNEKPAELAFLLDYIESSRHPVKDRVRAMRVRRQMKELIA